jgi:tRNA(Ser,Leu) C12 N-acetylase TAN1
MQCVINTVLEQARNKNKRLEVISRYIRLKYKIRMDISTLKNRIKGLKNYPLYEVA